MSMPSPAYRHSIPLVSEREQEPKTIYDLLLALVDRAPFMDESEKVMYRNVIDNARQVAMLGTMAEEVTQHSGKEGL